MPKVKKKKKKFYAEHKIRTVISYIRLLLAGLEVINNIGHLLVQQGHLGDNLARLLRRHALLGRGLLLGLGLILLVVPRQRRRQI